MLTVSPVSAELVVEEGPPRALDPVDGMLPAVAETGYHRLRVGGQLASDWRGKLVKAATS